ncbi:hypothetical protein H4S14_002047 [Agrobacterium vitis]|nr:hypothetical protein [Agrobacterium vitis]MBE1438302.1 hypothetical protein [Agrobacterium vitis]
MTTVGTTSSYSTTTGYTPRSSTNDAGTDAAFADLFEEPKNTDASVSTDETEKTTVHIGETEAFTFQGQTFYRLNVDLAKGEIRYWELPEDQYNDFVERQQDTIDFMKSALESAYTEYTQPDLSNEPRLKAYATVTVGGQIVATIDNQGVVESSNSDYLRFSGALLDMEGDVNGPDMAQRRAEKIASALGGQVQKASTAMTQSEFDSLPEIAGPTITIDYDAMQNDPEYTALQNMYLNYETRLQQRAEYLAQQSAA